jgi:hypothetical protein
MRLVHRLAQLDDHSTHRRSDFKWRPPFVMQLKARASAENLPGTWGFGLWNEPFSFLRSHEGFVPRLPALPQAAWFFFASQQNDLSLRDDLPPNGFLAATFKSRRIPFPLLGLASPILALALIPGIARLVRKALRPMIRQDAALIATDVTEWHDYRLNWDTTQVNFSLDGKDIFHTNTSPFSPMSLVIWIDNEYAALPARGSLRIGSLPNPETAWLEIKDFSIQ